VGKIFPVHVVPSDIQVILRKLSFDIDDFNKRFVFTVRLVFAINIFFWQYNRFIDPCRSYVCRWLLYPPTWEIIPGCGTPFKYKASGYAN
jgi:hypothetical protein